MAGVKLADRTVFEEESVRQEVQKNLSKYQDTDQIILYLGFAPKNLVDNKNFPDSYCTVYACDAAHIKTKEGGNIFDIVLKDGHGSVRTPLNSLPRWLLTLPLP